jgi:hypothetical protein
LGTYQLENVENIPYGGGFQVLLQINARDLLQLNLDKLKILCSPPPSSLFSSSSSPIWQYLSPSSTSHENHQSTPPPPLTPKQLYKPITSEASLVKYKNKWMVASLRFVDRFVQICESADLVGSWSCYNVGFASRTPTSPASRSSSSSSSSSSVSTLSHLNEDTDYITYAAKIHLQMSSKKFMCGDSDSNNNSGDSIELVVSVMSNTLEGPSMLFKPEYMSIYTPRFYLLQNIQ